MFLFRILLIGFLLYWAVKLTSSILRSGRTQPEVKGKPHTKPIDLSDADIEDVDFEETEEKE